VVVSHTPHYRGAGDVVGWGPTVRELDALASLTDELVHIAPLHDGSPTNACESYRAENVRFVPVSPAGGPQLRDKLGIVRASCSWGRTIRRELDTADAVHVRCPANISAVTLLLLATRSLPKRRWFKYAGTWDHDSGVPHSYRAQRWLLLHGKRLHRGIVTVPGSRYPLPEHVRHLRNPIRQDAIDFDRVDLPDGEVRLIFAGRLERSKGATTAYLVAQRIVDRGHAVRLDMAGEGPDRRALQSLEAGAVDGLHVAVHGWLSRSELDHLYASAHFVLLPSLSEGFPKVLAEGMAFGAVPLAADVGAIGQEFEALDAGIALESSSVDDYASAVIDLITPPSRWAEASRQCRRASEAFSYRTYLEAVAEILRPSG